MNTALLRTIIVIFTATACAQQNNPNEASQPCGQPVDGIALCLSRSTEPEDLTLEVKNVGEKDAVLNLGIVLANGARQYPTAITLIFSKAEGGRFRHELDGPVGVAGRIDPFIVLLPSHASLKLPLHATYGWYFRNYILDLKHYTVQAEFKGRGVTQAQAGLDVKGISLMPYWTGTVVSNTVAIDGN
jgi:hypothetical protein